jgi:hypothetical protein
VFLKAWKSACAGLRPARMAATICVGSSSTAKREHSTPPCPSSTPHTDTLPPPPDTCTPGKQKLTSSM